MVDPNLELFLREAWREELVEFIRLGSWGCGEGGAGKGVGRMGYQ